MVFGMMWAGCLLTPFYMCDSKLRYLVFKTKLRNCGWLWRGGHVLLCEHSVPFPQYSFLSVHASETDRALGLVPVELQVLLFLDLHSKRAGITLPGSPCVPVQNKRMEKRGDYS